MANFQFRLQSIEKLRTRNRDAAAESLRQAHEAMQHLNDQISLLDLELNDQAALQGQATTGIIQTQRVLESQRYQLHLHGQVKMLHEKLSLIEQECQRRKQILVVREAELKALEKLRNSQWEQWNQVQTARAQSRLDEWAGFRHWANSPSNLSNGE